MDDLAALHEEISARYKAAGARCDEAVAAIRDLPTGTDPDEWNRLVREEAEARGAWHAWHVAHQLAVKQRMKRADRKARGA